jgi:hypothetical protein
MVSRLKEQLDAVRRETSTWPEWRKLEIEAEVLKTPMKGRSGQNSVSGQTSEGVPDTGRPTAK